MISDPLYLFTIFATAGAATFAIRLSFIALEGRLQVPGWFRTALQFVPVAVLTAILMPELVLRAGEIALAPDNARLVAGAGAVLLAAWTRNVALTIGGGMAILLLWQAFAIPLMN